MKAKTTSKPSWAKHQKRWFGKWHTYLGIVAGAIIAFVGLTGSILVFQDEIDRALNKELFEVAAQKRKLGFDELIPLIRKNHPNLQFDYLSAGKNNSPFEAYTALNLKTQEQTFINPYTGELSGKRLYSSSFIRVVTDLHRTLLVPVVGKYIVGLAALSLLILTVSGLRLWLPKKWKQLKSALTVKFDAKAKRQNYDWHNVLGIYSSPVVFTLSLTGFCITFSNLVVPLLFIFAGQSPTGVAKLLGVKSAYTTNARPLPLSYIVKAVEEKMPSARLAGIAMPADKYGTYRLDILSGTLPVEGQREMLIVDQYTGKVLLNSRTDFPNVGNAYLGWLTPIHYGSFGGRPTQILALIGGLIPLALFITGFVIWWPRHRKAKSKQQKQLPLADVHSVAEKPAKQKPGLWRTFILQLKKGFGYAGIVLPLTALTGALYGLFAGIVIQPMVFAVAFTCILVALNFICALLAEIFNVLFLLPFKRGSVRLTRYFALSFSFFVVFLLSYFLILNTGMKIF